MKSDAPESAPAIVPPAPALGRVRPVLRTLARSIVPEWSALEERDRAEAEAIIDRAVARRPASMQRQLRVFLRLLDLLPLFRWGRTLRGLDPDRRARFLHGVQNSRLFLLRRGFWGVRTLVFMGYYSRPDAYDAVGYDARLRGWLEHPDASPEARETTLRQADRTADAGPAGDPPSVGRAP